MLLFDDEVKNIKELTDKLIKYDDIHKVKVCVIAFIKESDNRYTLQLRGSKARDEVGKIEAVGGSLNKSDHNLENAILRELREETGTSAKYQIGSYLGVCKETKYDLHTNEYIDWIIIGYQVIHISGDIVNMEPGRCQEFVTRKLNEFKKEELSDSCYTFIRYMIDNRV